MNKKPTKNCAIGTPREQNNKNSESVYVPSKTSKSSYSVSSIFPDAKTRRYVLAEVKKVNK